MAQFDDKVAIVGIGHTEFSKDSGRSEMSLAVEAILAAVQDAGLTPKDIDGIMKFSMDNCDVVNLAANLGIPELHFFLETPWGGGGGPSGTILGAAMAIATGMAECVVAFRSLNERSGRGTPRFGQAGVLDQAPGITSYMAPFGLFSPAQQVALAARKHMELYGTKIRHFGHIAVACRKHANQNPHAMMYGRPMTLEDYENSRLISDPVRLFDCCLETDGAAAVVLTTVERARNLRHPPVYVMAGAFGAGAWNTKMMIKDITLPETESTVIAKQIFHRAGITHKDVDVLFLYDHFVPLVLFAIEELGFCPRGEAGPFIEDGKLEWPNGSLPMNTSGGNLSEGYVHGIQNIAEAVRQLRGTSRCQVKDAEICFHASGNAVPTTAVIFRR